MSGIWGDVVLWLGRILPRRPSVCKKNVLLVTSVGGLFALFVTAIYMRRKRKPLTPRGISEDRNKNIVGHIKYARRKRRPKAEKLHGEDPSISTTYDESRHSTSHRRDNSMMSESSTVSSVRSSASRRSRIPNLAPPGTRQYYEAEGYYRRGVDAFEAALEQWEKAGVVLETSDKSGLEGARQPADNVCNSKAGDRLTSDDERTLNNTSGIEDKLLQFVERAEKLRQTFEDVLYSSGSETESDTDMTVTGYDVDSDTASFVSAQEAWEIRSVEEYPNHRFALYEEALVAVDAGKVRCRTLRTDMLECYSDTEFLAKLHCVRQAVDLMLQDTTVRDWLTENGRMMIEYLLRSANRNTSHFIDSFNVLTDYVKDQGNWNKIEDELKLRKVVSMTFYDVVFDFIIMDSFDDLANPPSQLVAVLGNRWLSNSIKETALNTAVWSLLKAKTRMLRYQDGFVAKFYALSETISPVLAWGFLGTDDRLKSDCEKFKSEVLSFLRGAFNFEQVRYSTLEQLSDDILRLAKCKVQLVMDHFNGA